MGSKASSGETSGQSSRHRRHKRHSAARPFMVLHSLNIIFAFVSICIFTAIIPLWNNNFFHQSGMLRGDWPDGLPILPLFITFSTSMCFLVKLGIERRRLTCASNDYLKTRNSSASTAGPAKIQLYISLTILVLLLTFLILAGISGLYRFWRPAVLATSVQLSSGTASTLSSITLSSRRDISSSNPASLTPSAGSSSGHQKAALPTVHSCTLANVFTRKCNPTLYLLGDLQIAAISTGGFVWFVNLMLLILQARDFQLQNRRHERSLRAKAKAKFGLMEDDLSRVEKGAYSTAGKKIHHVRQERQTPAHFKTRSDSFLPTSSLSAPNVTRPKQAHTSSSLKREASDLGHPAMRPKQHHYNPGISPSRSRSTREQPRDVSDHGQKILATYETPYSRAVEEARRKVKPAESMSAWLDRRRP